MYKQIAGAAAVVAIAGAGLTGLSSGATAGAAYGDPCQDPLPQGSESVTLDPADFVGEIDNPFLPMAVGSTWVARETDVAGNPSKVRIDVLKRTKPIVGIEATVVHDTLREHGKLVENTFDWYAQDSCGNVWYLGENTREYKNGEVVSTEGSWETGVDGGQAGIAMPGNPQVGLTYRQEYYQGQAEDNAKILSLDEQVQVPYGHFRHALLIAETTPLEPRILEYKLYAQDVGLTLAVGISGGSDREALLRFHKG